MKCFALDSSGDIFFVNGMLEMLENKENLKQRVKNSLISYQGDWFLSPEIGVDWFSFFGKKQVSEKELQIAIKENLQKDLEITKIEELEIEANKEKRQAIITIKLQSKYGELEVSI